MVSSRWCTWWCPRQSGGSITRGQAKGRSQHRPTPKVLRFEWLPEGVGGPPCLRTCPPRSPQDPEMAEDLLGGTSSLSAGCPATIGFDPCQVVGIRSGGRGVRPTAGDPTRKIRQCPRRPPPFRYQTQPSYFHSRSLVKCWSNPIQEFGEDQACRYDGPFEFGS